MLAEQVYGRGPGGQSGTSILRMMKSQESGDGDMIASILDASRFSRRV